MKRVFSLLFLLFTLMVETNAQIELNENSNIRTYLNNMFSLLDFSKVPSGLLRDYAVEAADLDIYNGEEMNDSNYVSRDAFANILNTISSATVYGTPINPTSILESQNTHSSSTNCAIALALYKYSFIKQNALVDNLISYDNEKVADKYKNGVWCNPYDTGYTASFAPHQITYNSNTITFSFPSDIWLSNLTCERVEFDAGSGSYRTITPGSSFSQTYNSGIHHLRLKATLTNGKILYAHTMIKTSEEYSSAAVTRAVNIQGTNRESLSTTYNGQSISGYLWFHQLNNDSVRKPFIIVEGFDPNELAFNAITEHSEFGYGSFNMLTFIKNEEGTGNSRFLQRIIQNYDVFYLDMKNCENGIEANAALLQEAIRYINNRKAHDSEKNIILGRSMGGLVARNALTDMESRGEHHETNLFIAQDSPFLGANVPLGALYALYALNGLYTRYLSQFISASEDIAKIKMLVQSLSVQQMLFNYVDNNGRLYGAEHSIYVGRNSYRKLPVGDHGDDMRCLAICNGSSNNIDTSRPLVKFQGELNFTELSNLIASFCSWLTGGAIMALSHDWTNFILGILPGGNKFKGQAEINPTGVSSPLCKIKLTYVKKFLWTVNINHTFFDYSSPNYTGIYYDLAKGSSLNLASVITSIPNSNYDWERFVMWQYCVDNQLEEMRFIPTVSSLYISKRNGGLAQSDYERSFDMLSNRVVDPYETPFDSYYITPSQAIHTTFTSDICDWLDTQLSKGIEGNLIATDGSRYVLRGSNPSDNITWESSDESIASIDEDGVITMHSHGIVTIKCNCLINGINSVYRKKIMVGFPIYIINDSHEPTQHTVKFETSEVIPDEFLSKITPQYCITPGDWNNGTTVSFPLVENGPSFNVYFRLCCEDNVSDVSYINICTSFPYILEPNYFKMNYQTKAITPVVLKKNPFYTGELTDAMKIRQLITLTGAKTNVNIPYRTGVFELTLQGENVFRQDQIDAVINNGVATSNFKIAGESGKIIQNFITTLSYGSNY